MIACNECKGTNISEQLWVNTNDIIFVKGKSGFHTKTYYAIDYEMQDKASTDIYLCLDCNEDTIVYDNEDKESEVA